MAHDVFISYAKNDREVADAICAGLEGQGIRCWIPAEQRQGFFSFAIHSTVPQQVTLNVTLVDARNRRSNSYPLTFEVKRSAAAARDRSLEIDTPQGLKFKIPR